MNPRHQYKIQMKPRYWPKLFPPLVWTYPDSALLLRCVAPRCRVPHTRHRLMETRIQTRNVREGDQNYYW